MKNKGQSAMEYLLNYGWIFLVVLFAGLALWQFGAFDIQPNESECFEACNKFFPNITYHTENWDGGCRCYIGNMSCKIINNKTFCYVANKEVRLIACR